MRSISPACTVTVSIEEQRAGILDQLLDTHEEPDGFGTVNDAMVVGQSDVHHGPEDDLPSNRHRALLDLVEPEDPDLRRIQDGRAQKRAEYAAVGDGERAAFEIREGERAVLRAPREIADLFLDLGERHPVRVAENRHHQTFARANSDTDVVIPLEDHFVTLDLRIDPGELTERADRSLHEERRDTEANAVPLLEGLLVALPQRHHGGHVHFVE